MAAQKLAVEAALARRMFHAPRLYRWVLRNLQELPAEGGERDYYCQMARAEFDANSFETRPDELALLWQESEEKVDWILQKYGRGGVKTPLPSPTPSSPGR
ncbi:LYRM9 [Symbiodinium sp. KB8]|nr:LYRM9 [Symbiodinium sp. KB8]